MSDETTGVENKAGQLAEALRERDQARATVERLTKSHAEWILAAEMLEKEVSAARKERDEAQKALDQMTKDCRPASCRLNDASKNRAAYRLKDEALEVRIAEARVLAAAILKMTEGCGE